MGRHAGIQQMGEDDSPETEDEKQRRLAAAASPVAQPAPAPPPMPTDALKSQLAGMQTPAPVVYKPVASESKSYEAKQITGPLPEYEYMRKKAIEQANQQASASQDAITRKFAAMGASNSGTAIKQAQISDEQLAGQKATALEGIGVQEAQARRALQQGEEQKAFQSSEAMAGRNAGREQLNAQLGLNTDMANRAALLQDAWQRFDAGSKLAAMDMSYDQFKEQFGWQKSQADRETAQADWANKVSAILGADLGDDERIAALRKLGVPV